MQSASPIVPWIGGKRRLADRILPRLGRHTCYVELFAGAAAIFFAKPPSEVEVLNDVNGDLVNLYRVVQHHLEEFVRQFKWALTSRQIYEWHKMTAPETLTDIQRAARFYYLQRLSFGGRVAGQSYGTATTSGSRLNLLRMEEDLSAAHLRLADVQVEHLSWEAAAARYERPHTLFYADPPYWSTEGYGVAFPLEQYTALGDFAQGAEAQVVISVNDHPAMRQAFTGLHLEEVDIRYTVGGGEGSAARELLLWNDRAERAPKGQVSLPMF